MRIESVKIQNFKSFRASEEIRFAPGFNLIVGKNNSGKSSLLKTITLNFKGTPHLDINLTPDTVAGSSGVEIAMVFTGGELRDLLTKRGLQQKCLWPKGVQVDAHGFNSAVQNILSQLELRIAARKVAKETSGAEWTSPTAA